MRNPRSNPRSKTSKQTMPGAKKTAPSSSGESPSNNATAASELASDDATSNRNEIMRVVKNNNEAAKKKNQTITINSAVVVVDGDRIGSVHNDDAGNKEEQSTESTRLLTSNSNAPTTITTTTTTTPTDESKGNKAGPPPGNELTHLIPGYIAPMRLESKLLVGHQSGSSSSSGSGSGSGIANHAASVSKLRQRASLAEAARYIPPTTTTKGNQRPFTTTTTSVLSNGVNKPKTAPAVTNTTSFLSSYRKTISKIVDHTAGAGWFHMNPTPMTSQLKTDLSLIRNRNYLDPKKFYKSADGFDGKILQVGTVIEGSAEYYSSRLTRKERRRNITEELMADAGVRQYAKRKFLEIQVEKERSSSSSGRNNSWKKKGGGGGGGSQQKTSGRKGR